MKTKQSVSSKKQTIKVQDLKAKKNPTGGAETVHLYLKANGTDIKGDSTQAFQGNNKKSAIFDRWGNL